MRKRKWTKLSVLVLISAFLALLLPFALRAEADPVAPTVTQLGITPFFMMGNAVAGLAQETTAVYKATDGTTNRNNYNITATVTGTSSMTGTPTVTVNTLADSDSNAVVYFTVGLRCGVGMVTGPASTADVKISVTSNATQLTGELIFTCETFQDLDRP